MKSWAKRFVKKAIETRGYQICQSGYLNVFEAVLNRRLALSDGEFVFIEIGGNDGVSNDPVYPFVTRNHQRVRGVIVEPMVDVYKQLKQNYYRYPSIECVNVGIHNEEKEMTLYRVDPAKACEAPAWAKGIASFDPDHHKRSGLASDLIIEESVKCMSLIDLCEQYQVTECDLVQIDTEGYDSEIINGIDFDAFRPKIIHFEHLIGCGEAERNMFDVVSERLRKYDYAVVVDSEDAIAISLDCFRSMDAL